MRKIKVLLSLLLLSLSLFGCSSKQDINELLFVSAIGIDKSESGFKLVAQIVNKNVLVPDPPEESPVLIHTAEGLTVADAFSNMADALPNRPYLINLQLLVFSEDIAKENIKDYLHLFVNYNEAQHEYNVVITKDVTAEDFLSQISVFSVFPTRILINKIKSAEKNYGFSKETFIEEVIDGVHSESEVLLLTSITIDGDIKKGQDVDINKKTINEALIKVSELGVLKKGKLIGWLSKDESRTYNFVNDNIERALLVVDGTENNLISSLVTESKGKIKVDVKSGKPTVKFEIDFKAIVVEDTSGNIRMDNAYFKDIEQKLNNQITSDILKLIEKSKNELSVDLFGLADYFYKYEPKWWKVNKENFSDIYKELTIEVYVSSKMKR